MEYCLFRYSFIYCVSRSSKNINWIPTFAESDMTDEFQVQCELRRPYLKNMLIQCIIYIICVQCVKDSSIVCEFVLPLRMISSLLTTVPVLPVLFISYVWAMCLHYITVISKLYFVLGSRCTV